MILSTTFANAIIAGFKGTPIVFPASFYIGLLNASNQEVSMPSYTRIQYQNSQISWATNTNNTSMSNVAPITWNVAMESWGPVNKLRFYLTPTGSDYWFDVEFLAATINANDTFEILSNELVVLF